MPWRISSRLGDGFAATSAAAETICPGVQKPHWSASARTKASTSGWSCSPSIVVTSPGPTVWTSVRQESTGTPSSCTVQAPQCPSLQATFVPVSPSSSRSTSASEVPTAASTACASPLTRSSSIGGHGDDVGEVDEREGRAAHPRPLALVLDLRQRAPQLLGGREELSDLVELLRIAV